MYHYQIHIFVNVRHNPPLILVHSNSLRPCDKRAGLPKGTGCKCCTCLQETLDADRSVDVITGAWWCLFFFFPISTFEDWLAVAFMCLWSAGPGATRSPWNLSSHLHLRRCVTWAKIAQKKQKTIRSSTPLNYDICFLCMLWEFPHRRYKKNPNKGILSIVLNNEQMRSFILKSCLICTFTMLSKSYVSDVVEITEACVLVQSLFVAGN